MLESREPVFILLKSTAWLEEQEGNRILGSVVKNFWAPTDNYEPKAAIRYNKNIGPLVTNSFDDFVALQEEGVGKSAETKLKGLGNFSWAGRADEKFDLRGKRIRYKKLRSHEKFWAALKKDPAVKDTLPQWLRSRWFGGQTRHPICLITGLYICEQVTMASSKEEQNLQKASITVPILTAATAAHGIPLMNGQGSLELAVHHEEQSRKYIRVQDAKPQVFALQVKVIKTEFFNKQAAHLTDESPKIPDVKQLGSSSMRNPQLEDLYLADFVDESSEHIEEVFMNSEDDVREEGNNTKD